jgi:hypothetical protein
MDEAAKIILAIRWFNHSIVIQKFIFNFQNIPLSLAHFTIGGYAGGLRYLVPSKANEESSIQNHLHLCYALHD